MMKRMRDWKEIGIIWGVNGTTLATITMGHVKDIVAIVLGLVSIASTLVIIRNNLRGPKPPTRFGGPGTVVLLFVLASLCLALGGCSMPLPQKGGSAEVTTRKAVIQQGENPAEVSRQEHNRAFERSYIVPVGSEIVSWTVALPEVPGEVPQTNFLSVRAAEPIVVTEKEVTGGKTELGASWKDTARELGAKLSAMRPVQWAGIALCVGSVAAFYFGWPSLGFLAIAVGLGMIVAAAVIPGRETLILFVGGIGLALIALAVVYAYSKGKLDANKNGIPDFLEPKGANV